jgi:outer membrane lipoprotein-sorting protein
MRTGIAILLIGLFASVIAPVSVRAADWPDALKNAQARCEQIHAAIKDLTIEQDMTASTPQGEINAEQKIYQKGDKSRMEMTMHMPGAPGADGMKSVIINDGADAWMISPMTGKQKLPPEQARQQQITRDCWGFTPANSRITGSDTLAGHECWLVEFTEDSVTHTLYLDKNSLLVRGGLATEGGVTVRWQLSDFRKVLDGYEHPYRIEVFDGSQLLSTMTVKSVTVNTGLSDALFDASKEEVPPNNMEEMMRKMLEQQNSGGEGKQ